MRDLCVRSGSSGGGKSARGLGACSSLPKKLPGQCSGARRRLRRRAPRSRAAQGPQTRSGSVQRPVDAAVVGIIDTVDLSD